MVSPLGEGTPPAVACDLPFQQSLARGERPLPCEALPAAVISLMARAGLAFEAVWGVGRHCRVSP